MTRIAIIGAGSKAIELLLLMGTMGLCQGTRAQIVLISSLKVEEADLLSHSILK